MRKGVMYVPDLADRVSSMRGNVIYVGRYAPMLPGGGSVRGLGSPSSSLTFDVMYGPFVIYGIQQSPSLHVELCHL
jgi:hypothetical protein